MSVTLYLLLLLLETLVIKIVRGEKIPPAAPACQHTGI